MYSFGRGKAGEDSQWVISLLIKLDRRNSSGHMKINQRWISMVLVPRCFTCPNDKVELRLNAVTILKVFCGFFRTDDLQMRLFEQPTKRGVLTPLGHQLVVTGAIFNKSWHQSQGTPIWTQLTRKTGKTDHWPHVFMAIRGCQVCSPRVSHGSGGYGGTWLFRGKGNGIPKWHGICLLGVGPGFLFGFLEWRTFQKNNSIWMFEDVYSEILLMATRNPGSTHQLSLVVSQNSQPTIPNGGLALGKLDGRIGPKVDKAINTPRGWGLCPTKTQCHTTVDGRNPALVDMVNIPLFTTGFSTILGVAGFRPSSSMTVTLIFGSCFVAILRDFACETLLL